MGKHGIGKRNKNGEKIVELFELKKKTHLVISGTIFPP
jgi:hypothetical protein